MKMTLNFFRICTLENIQVYVFVLDFPEEIPFPFFNGNGICLYVFFLWSLLLDYALYLPDHSLTTKSPQSSTN